MLEYWGQEAVPAFLPIHGTGLNLLIEFHTVPADFTCESIPLLLPVRERSEHFSPGSNMLVSPPETRHRAGPVTPSVLLKKVL